MRKFTLLSAAAAAALASGDPATTGEEDEDEAAGPEPVTDPAPADQGQDTTTAPSEAAAQPEQVVAAGDVASLCADARAKGFAEANARMKTVFASEEAKANPSLAAFMLANSSASAEEIVGELKGQAPAAAPAASTTATIEPTGVDLGAGTDPAALAEQGPSEAETTAGWDAALAGLAAANAPLVPAANATAPAGTTVTAPALPRTGN